MPSSIKSNLYSWCVLEHLDAYEWTNTFLNLSAFCLFNNAHCCWWARERFKIIQGLTNLALIIISVHKILNNFDTSIFWHKYITIVIYVTGVRVLLFFRSSQPTCTSAASVLNSSVKSDWLSYFRK